ncbi:MAG: HD domain-containing phosphohydrolase [Thermodesulfobacteriota bacterium]
MKGNAAPRILIVDDQPEIGRLLDKWLRAEGLDTDVASDGLSALSLLKTGRYAVVVANVTMPGMTGTDFLARMGTLSLDVAVIMAAAAADSDRALACMGLGAFATLTKPLDRSELLTQVRGALENRALAGLMEDPGDVAEQTLIVGTQEFQGFRDFQSREEEIVLRLLSCCGLLSGEAQSHFRRVGICAAMLAEAMGWEHSAIEDMRVAAALHDIGKIGIPEPILHKAAKLTAQEVIVFRKHTIVGSLILGGSKIPMIRMAHDIALYHHERWDGSGYPAGLSGETIPHPARLVAVVDVYDALLHERRYRAQRPPVTEHHAIALMKRKKYSHFEPAIIECFLDMLPAMRTVHEDHKERRALEEMLRSIMADDPQG